MKKVLAIILCFVLSFALCISVAAEKSPVAKEKIQVMVRKASGTITNADGSKIEKKPDIFYAVEDGHAIEVTADENKYGKFDSWSVYKVVTEGGKTKYVAAVAGTDYTLVSGSLKDKTLKIEALVDLVLCANYDGKITDPALDSSAASKDPESPQTSDAVIPAILLSLLASVAVLGSKKVFAK